MFAGVVHNLALRIRGTTPMRGRSLGTYLAHRNVTGRALHQCSMQDPALIADGPKACGVRNLLPAVSDSGAALLHLDTCTRVAVLQ
jgi:hypothetical protein